MGNARGVWRRFVSFYRGLAVFVLNTLVLLALVHLGAWAWYSMRAAADPGSERLEFLGPRAAQLYPGWSSDDLRVLLNETWTRPLEYQPFYEFEERAFRGRFVNVSAEGFRHVRQQGPWPPSPQFFNVFVFGGSTTFGYGIADEETIASFLQQELQGKTPRPARVYNFACGHYYSTQERARFQQLLVLGFVPDLAVFVQGLNEFHRYDDRAYLSDPIHHLVEARAVRRQQHLPAWLTLFSPRRIRAELRPYQRPQKTPSSDPQLADRLIDRYLHNKKMTEVVAAAEAVPAVFVWQPVLLYRYDIKRFPLPGRPQPLTGIGTERMADRLKRTPPPENLIWAADLQDRVPDPLYVDAVHYAPNLCRAIARLAAEEMHRRGFLISRGR